MGKKSQNVFTSNDKTNIKQPIINNQLKITQNTNNQQNIKLSKRQKRKIKKQLKIINNNNNNIHDDKDSLLHKKTISQQKSAQVQQLELEQQLEQSLISLSSSMNQQGIQNLISSQRSEQQIDFKPKGKQGFQQLMNQSHQIQNQNTKLIEFKRVNNEGKVQNYFLYILKINNYYKVTSLLHQKLNSTHLNQSITLHIIQENLLKSNNQQKSLVFMFNGKKIQNQINFIKSTVFKIIQIQSNLSSSNKNSSNQQKKQKGKKNNHKNQQIIKQNIKSYLNPFDNQNQSNIIDFLKDLEWNEQSLLLSKEKLTFQLTQTPFQHFDQNLMKTNNSMLILGKKNSGKSMLSEYIYNSHEDSTCILDCDIGRSLTISGCVSLITKQQKINIWIGQFTPFNCINIYLKAIQQLYLIYRQKYFTKKLIINTMGYLNGLGQFILYQIYNIINPLQLIVINMETQNSRLAHNINLQNILYNLKTGGYIQKLLSQSSRDNQVRRFNKKKFVLQISHLKNDHSQSKGIPIRYQSIFLWNKNIRNISQLIKKIKRKQLQTFNIKNIYQQDKLGVIKKLEQCQIQFINMRIVLIATIVQKTKQNEQLQASSQQKVDRFFKIHGIGYGFENKVYFDRKIIEYFLSPNDEVKQNKNSIVGLIGQGIDFQKNFYLINQYNFIDLELQFGSIPYMMPIIKGMGSKGTRNNPSKNI